MLTLEQLQTIMPHLDLVRATAYLSDLNAAMTEGQINTKLRMAAFLAQVAHESCEFKYMEEIADGHAYEGRKDLGNIHPGDGKKYKGRGPIQLTGLNNYKLCGDDLGIDLVNHPEQAAVPHIGFRIAVWFWTKHNLNKKADEGDFVGITKSINGGENGLQSRLAYYHKALGVLDGTTN